MKEFSVMMVVFDEGGKVPAIGQVASALAGDRQFDPHPAHLFQKEDPASLLGSPPGRHQPGGPPADDDHIPAQGHFTAESAETAERRIDNIIKTADRFFLL